MDEVETLSSFLGSRKKEAPLCDGHLQVGTRFGYERGLQGKCPLALAICVAAGVCVCGAREAQMRGEDLRRVNDLCACLSVCPPACPDLPRLRPRACVRVADEPARASVHDACLPLTLCVRA